MIAEKGFEAITVRDLAEACRVSVPTLYNQFGGKDQLLAAAIEEHFAESRRQSTAREVPRGYERMMKVISDATEQLLGSSTYQRKLLEAFASLESTTKVQQKLADQFAAILTEELQHMSATGVLVDWADPRLLAGQVTTAFIGTSVVWASGYVDDDHLQSAMVYATGLILLGVVCGEVQADLTDKLKAAQQSLGELMRKELHRAGSATGG